MLELMTFAIFVVVVVIPIVVICLYILISIFEMSINTTKSIGLSFSKLETIVDKKIGIVVNRHKRFIFFVGLCGVFLFFGLLIFTTI